MPISTWEELKMSKNIRLNSRMQSKESFAYTANSIVEIAQQTGKKIFAFSSSHICEGQDAIILEIAKYISENIEKIFLLNVSITEDLKPKAIDFIKSDIEKLDIAYASNLSTTQFVDALTDMKDKYEMIFVSIDPLNIFAQALQYAKFCEGIFLLEKKHYTKYSEYEKTLSLLQQHDITSDGVIIY